MRMRFMLGGLIMSSLALLVPIRISSNAEFWNRLMDVAHIPFFAAFTVFMYASDPLGLAMPRQRLAAAALLALLLAGATEIIQPMTGREESYIDFRNGFFGIVLAYLAMRWAPRLTVPRFFTLTALTLLLTFYALQQPLRELRAILWRHSHFPLLGDFEDSAELPLWKWTGLRNQKAGQIDASTEFPSHGSRSLKVATEPVQWPGVRLRQDGADWRGFTVFSFEIYNPGIPFPLSLRIDDSGPGQTREERFNHALPLAHHWNHFCIPLEQIAQAPKTRRLDLAHIQRVVFFLDTPTTSHVFHLDHLRLERQ